ncbi:hypothetical protein EBZ35_07890 [bacterium]|nr:hypothetical protein [bacterium]
MAHVGQAPSPDPILSGLGTVGAVVAMNGLLDAQQPLRAGNVGSYYLDLEWHRPLTPQWSWHSMLGLYPLSTGMTTDWRWLYLLHHMPEISLTTHIGRHFIPFGWLSQQCNETSPFALAPLLSQYTWGGNIVGDGILGQWQIAGPWHLQVGGWVHEPKPGTTGFGPAHQLGLIRTVWDIKTKDGMGVSASLHHMKGSGPLHQTQQDHVEWVGADVKWDIPLGAQHTGTLLAEWVGIERQWGSQRFQRSGGYAAGWVANEWMDWGARIDWLEHPEAVLTTSHRMGLMLNIRHAPGTALQLFYSHDPGPQAAHQFGASYLMVIGSHHHTFR